jgi:hypothetical protein
MKACPERSEGLALNEGTNDDGLWLTADRRPTTAFVIRQTAFVIRHSSFVQV